MSPTGPPPHPAPTSPATAMAATATAPSAGGPHRRGTHVAQLRSLGADERWSPRTIAVVTALLVGLFATWALGIARYGGPDEPGHILRAAAVADGEVLGAPIPGLVNGFRAVTVPAGLGTGDPKCFRHDDRSPATCAHADRSARGDVRVGSSAGTNPPWYYAAVGLPVRALGDVGDAASYRLVGAALFAAVVACALARARGLGRFGPLVALVAMSPVVWFMGGVVNPSSLEIALALLAWIGVERVRSLVAGSAPSDEVPNVAMSGNSVVPTAAVPDPRSPPSPWARRRAWSADVTTAGELLWMTIPSGIAIAIRPIAVVGVATMALVLVLTCPGAIRPRGWTTLAAGPLLAGIGSLLWARYSATEVSDARAALQGSRWHFVRLAFEGTEDTIREIAGSLGWLEFAAPTPLQWLWWLGVAACGVSGWRGTVRTAWLAIVASALLFPVAFETALGDRLGPIWQGRYTIPTILGVVAIGSSAWLTRLRRAHAIAIVALIAVGEVATLWTALRRYTVGTNGSWLLIDARWHPPVSPWVLLAANALAMAGLAACTIGRAGPVDT